KMVMMGGTGYGWLSGQAIRPIALRFVYEIAKNVKIPVIGVGGIYSGEDAVEFIMAGASAVQICTAAILKGPKIFGQVAQELRKFLENHGYGSIDDIKGIALKRKAKKLVPIVNENCTGCGLCESSCPYGAIKIEKIAKIDEKKCFGCGLCVSRCRKTWVKALRFE
ncbi:MAG: 4Fe-4S binding protein, partial [Candidatus Thermoplasmatota archaeon]